MKRILILALTMLALVGCKKAVVVPATVTVDDINAILESKELDLETFKAFLPVFVEQYSQKVDAFTQNPTKDEAEDLESINKSVADAISTMEGIQNLVDDDFKLDLARHIKRLQRDKDNSDSKAKELLSSKKSHHHHSHHSSYSVDPGSYDYVKITGNGVRLRFAPSLNAGIYTQLNKGARVQRNFDDSSDWYGVYYAGYNLYVSRDFASLAR